MPIAPYRPWLILTALLSTGCGLLLDSTTALSDEVPDAAADAGVDAPMDADGEASSAAEQECLSRSRACRVARWSEDTARCTIHDVQDCEPCEGDSDGVCGRGRCLPSGVIFQENFDDGPLAPPWSSEGEHPWALDEEPYSGSHSVRSGLVPSDGQSLLTLRLEDVPTRSVVRFALRTMIQGFHDELVLRDQEQVYTQWSSTRPWDVAEVVIAGGEVVQLTWQFERGSLGDTSGYAWIDSVEVQLRCEDIR